MTDVFISYKREERDKARAVAEALAREGFDVWWDIDLLPGQDFAQEINAILEKTRAVLVLWTPEALGSFFVRAEAMRALELGKYVPATLRSMKLPVPFNAQHSADLSEWGGGSHEKSLDVLVRGVRQHIAPLTAVPGERSVRDVEAVLNDPSVEIEYWKSILLMQPQSVDKYHAYLEKYGAEAVFADLATLRIRELDSKGLPKSEVGDFHQRLLVATSTSELEFLMRDVKAYAAHSPKSNLHSLMDQIEQAIAYARASIDFATATAEDERAVSGHPRLPWRTPPPLFPAVWASTSGQDHYGFWCGFEIEGVEQRLRWIPPGEFLIGSPKDEPERYDNELLHPVTLTRGYWLAETACTQALWGAVMNDNPSHFHGADLPVETVSWNDIKQFIEQLNAKLPGLDGRLPTEAEWEYAARAGNQTPFWWGSILSPEQANYDVNYPYAGGEKGQYRQETIPVRTLEPNPWGLYQVHGNVWEWCEDWYGEYEAGPVEDPQGPKWGGRRVYRGGSWNCYGTGLRAAYRAYDAPDDCFDFLGFRLSAGQLDAEHRDTQP